MKHLSLILLFVVSACTSDHYAPIVGNESSKEYLNEDLKDCRDKAIHQRLSERNNGAALLGGIIGGAIGGAIFGAALSSGEDTSHPKTDVNKTIQSCMAHKGYDGVSEHYN